MKRSFLLVFLGLSWILGLAQQTTLPPDKIYGQLFCDVQLGSIFPDSKTFVDCIAKKNPEEILSNYLTLKKGSNSKDS